MPHPAFPARRSRRCRVSLVLVAALAACQQDPIAWSDAAERRLPMPPTGAATADPVVAADSLVRRTLRAALDATAPRAADTAAGAAVPAPPADPAGRACPASVRVAAGRGAERAAVWWSLRADRSAVLLASRSTDGGATWDAPVSVDTLDRGEAGCDRPAPSVAVDATNGFVHVAYSLAGPEGRGVFYAHRMDPRAPFEVPQVVVYGDRPAATGVASDGDVVVVAYEDPNTGGRPYVSLALSRTAGHTFDARFAASEGSSTSAERPAVAVRGRTVAVGWTEHPAPRRLTTDDDPRSATDPMPGGVVVRVGRLRE